jgi:hypothetical protein
VTVTLECSQCWFGESTHVVLSGPCHIHHKLPSPVIGRNFNLILSISAEPDQKCFLCFHLNKQPIIGIFSLVQPRTFSLYGIHLNNLEFQCQIRYVDRTLAEMFHKTSLLSFALQMITGITNWKVWRNLSLSFLFMCGKMNKSVVLMNIGFVGTHGCSQYLWTFFM